MRRSTINLLLLLGVIAIFAIAVGVGIDRGEFGGTDAAATEEIAAAYDYEPWFEPFWTQPGGEVESGLFALQAALGAAVLGFALGTLRERGRNRRKAGAGSQPDPT